MAQHPLIVDGQAELMSYLLSNHEPGAYAVLDMPTLTTQLKIAIRETTDSNGRVRPEKVAVRLVRTLLHLGFIVNTRYENLDGPSQ